MQYSICYERLVEQKTIRTSNTVENGASNVTRAEILLQIQVNSPLQKSKFQFECKLGKDETIKRFQCSKGYCYFKFGTICMLLQAKF